ncbi:MAG: hypothetical protein HGGPFJEG_03070 [Ignavibacteria bacterium]|nr:hypothetical protein [Ignavibacteria bacterium]
MAHPYIDKDYILSIITEADYTELTGGVDANLDTAVADAGDDIDFYCASRVSVPLEEVPKMIKRICADLTIYNLHSRTQSNRVPDMAREKYEDAILKLKDISAGKGKLPFAEDPKPTPESSVIVSGFDPVMSRDMF